MDMTGEYRIPAPRQKVWDALNDPDMLKAVHPRLRKPRKDLRHRDDGDGRRQGRARVGEILGAR